MWVACENTDDLPYVLSHAGEDALMIGTDYGHHDPSSELNAIRLLRDDRRIAPEVIDKILEANPRKFYGLDLIFFGFNTSNRSKRSSRSRIQNRTGRGVFIFPPRPLISPRFTIYPA